MKKETTAELIVAAVVLLAAPALMGSTIVLNLDPVNYTAKPGGEYNAQTVGLVGGQTPSQILAGYDSLAKAVVGGSTGFQTFCLEESEGFTPGKSYQVVANDRAVAGGANLFHPVVTPGADILSVGTTWLYSQFAQGTLPGYTYVWGAGRVASAKALQATIWWLEDAAADPGALNTFRNAVVGSFVNPKLDAAPGLDGVHALNLTLRDGTLKQDVLIYQTPEGGVTVTLLGFGLAAIGVFGLRVKQD